MKADHLLRALMLAVSVALLAAVILLMLEVRQVGADLAAASIRERGDDLQQAMQLLALSDDLAAILAKARGGSLDELSDSEQIRLWAWEFARSIRIQRQFNDRALGHLDDTAYQVMLSSAAEAYPLWQKLGIRLSDPALVAAIERQIAAANFVSSPGGTQEGGAQQKGTQQRERAGEDSAPDSDAPGS